MPVIEKTPAEPVSANYVDFDEFIEHQLRKTRSGIHQTDLLSAGVVLLCLLSGYLLLFALLDQWVIPDGFSQTARILLLSGVVVLAAGWIGWKIVLPWLRSINALYAARQIEQAHPELQGSLLSWVNFRQTGRDVSPSILAALERRTAHQISHTDVDQAIDRKLLMQASYLLLGLVVAICLYTLISPKKMSTTLWRALFPASSVSAATRTEIRDVKPGNAEVLAREQIDVIAELGGQIPQEATLRFSTADRRFVNEPVKMVRTDHSLPRFQARLTGDGGKGLLSDLSYFIEAGDARSATYQIRVNQPPSAEVFELEYEYPRYTGLSRTVQSGTTIEAWEGTMVTVRAKTNMPVKKAILYCSDAQTAVAAAEEYPMTVQDDLLTARWQLRFRDDGTFARYYHIQVWNERNQKNPYPTVHRIQVRPDLKPEVKLISPAKDQSVPANAQIPLAFAARDPDFLLRRVTLRIQKNGELLPYPPPLFAAPPERAELKSVYRLDLQQLSATAGDQLTLWIEAEDNFEPFGKRVKNVGRSPQITLTVTDPVSEEQLNQEQRKQEDQLQENIDNAPAEDQPTPPEHPENRTQQDLNRTLKENPAQRDQMQQPLSAEKQSPPMQEGGPDNQQNSQSQPSDPQNPGQKMPQQGTPPAQQQQQNGEQQNGQGDSGSQPSGKSSEGNQTSPQSAGSQSGSTGQAQNRSEQGGQGAAHHSTESKQNPAALRSDKAADDQALERLLKWNREQQQKQQQQTEGSNPMQRGPSGSSTTGDSSPPPQSADTPRMPTPEGSAPADTSRPQQNPSEKNSSTDPMSSSKGSGQDSENSPEQPRPKREGETSSPDTPTPGTQGSQPKDSATGEQQPTGNGSGKNPDQKQIPRQESAPRGQEAEGQSSPSKQQQGKPNQQQGESGTPSPSDSSMSPGQSNDSPDGRGQSTSSPQMTPPGSHSSSKTQDSSSPEHSDSKTPPGTPADGLPSPDNGSPKNPSGRPQLQTPQGQEPDKPSNGEEAPNAPSSQPVPSAEPNGTSGKSGEMEKGGPRPENSTQSGRAPGENPQQNPPTNSMPQQTGTGSTPKPMPGTGRNSQPENPPSGTPPATSSDGTSPQEGAGKMKAEPLQNGNTPDGQNPAGTPGDGHSSSKNPSQLQQKGQPGTDPTEMNGPPNGNTPQRMEGAPHQSGGSQTDQSGEKASKPSSSDTMGEGKPGNQQRGSGQKQPDQQMQPGRAGDSGQTGDPKGRQSSDGMSGPSPTPSGNSSKEGSGSQGASGSQDSPSGQGTGSSTGQQAEPPSGEGNGRQSSTGAGGTPGNRSSQPAHSGATENGSQENLDPEQADLANKRKATELALKRLRSQLERGETPRELMDDLGYTQQDLERFMQKLEQRLADPGIDHSPESEAARRQFDSILKGIDYQSTGQKRSGGTHERKASRSAGSENRLAPPQYRRDSEAYKENLSREGTGR